MVLKRPYAFLIKHFRLIHLIIAAIFGYVALKNRGIYLFLKKVIVDNANRYDAKMYISYGLFGYILLALVLCFLVQWLLKYKEKPRGLYKFTIVIYVIISIFMFILFTYMSGFSIEVIAQKTIRLYRDVMTIVLLFQYYIVFAMLIRGLGFDIKKFDFNRDVRELNLEEADSEEVEVNTHVDTTNLVRTVRKGQREFGYFFKEFKIYIIVIILIVLLILGYKGYNYFNAKYRVYNENDYFGNQNIVSVKNSYYSTVSNKQYIIISFDIYRYGVKGQFNVGNMALLVGNDKYIANKNVCYKFSTLGNCYKKQYVTEEPTNYILVYEVSKIDTKRSYLIYSDSYDQNYKVKLNVKEY